MSSNPLNDLSQVYLDQVANVKKAENEADIQRWEEIGGPTPTNYKPTGGSAKIKTESTIDLIGGMTFLKQEILMQLKHLDLKIQKMLRKKLQKSLV